MFLSHNQLHIYAILGIVNLLVNSLGIKLNAVLYGVLSVNPQDMITFMKKIS